MWVGFDCSLLACVLVRKNTKQAKPDTLFSPLKGIVHLPRSIKPIPKIALGSDVELVGWSPGGLLSPRRNEVCLHNSRLDPFAGVQMLVAYGCRINPGVLTMFSLNSLSKE